MHCMLWHRTGTALRRTEYRDAATRHTRTVHAKHAQRTSITRTHRTGTTRTMHATMHAQLMCRIALTTAHHTATPHTAAQRTCTAKHRQALPHTAAYHRAPPRIANCAHRHTHHHSQQRHCAHNSGVTRATRRITRTMRVPPRTAGTAETTNHRRAPQAARATRAACIADHMQRRHMAIHRRHAPKKKVLFRITSHATQPRTTRTRVMRMTCVMCVARIAHAARVHVHVRAGGRRSAVQAGWVPTRRDWHRARRRPGRKVVHGRWRARLRHGALHAGAVSRARRRRRGRPRRGGSPLARLAGQSSPWHTASRPV